MSERPPRKAVKKETASLQSETEQQFLDHLASAVQVEAEKKLNSGHDLMPQEIREKLDQIGNNPNSTLESFNTLLRDAEEAGGGALSLTWLEDIGKTAATQLRGKDFNAFKRHVTKKYELNEKGIPELHPELNFLRIKPKSEKKPSTTNRETAPQEHMPVPVVGSQEYLPSTDSKGVDPNVIDAEYTVLDDTPVPVPPDALKSHEQIGMEKLGLKYHAPKTGPESTTSESERPLFSEPARRMFEGFERDLTPFEERKYLKDLIEKAELGKKFEASKNYLSERSKWLQAKLRDYTPKVVKGVSSMLGSAADVLRNLLSRKKEKGGTKTPEAVTAASATSEQPPAPEVGSEKKMLDAREIAMQKAEALSPKEKADEEGDKHKIESKEGLSRMEFLKNRSKELGDKASFLGAYFADSLKNKAESYNKLNWKTKLALTGALTIGAGATVAAAPAISQILYGALVAQRIVGGFGTALNKRKAIDEKIAKNPNSHWKNRSELTKNLYAGGLALAWTYGSGYVVREAFEAVAHLAQAPQAQGIWQSIKHVAGKAQQIAADSIPSPDNDVDFEKDSLESLEGHFKNNLAPGENPQPYDGTTPQMEKDFDEILQYQGPVSDYFKETYGGKVGLAPDEEYIKTLAADSLVKDLPSGDQALIDNHIASLSQWGRGEFDKYVTKFTLNPDSMPVTGARPEEYFDATISKHINALNDLSKESALAQGMSLEQWEEANSELSKLRENGQPLDTESVNAAIERAKEHLQNINTFSKEAEGVFVSPSETVPVDSGGAEDRIGANRMHDAVERTEGGLSPEETGNFSGLNSGTDKELAAATRRPDLTAETLSNVIRNASGLEISKIVPQIYENKSGELFVFGGDSEARVNFINEYLKANTDKVLLTANPDDKFTVRYSLNNHSELDVQPVYARRSWYSLFASLKDAPKPDEFVKKVQ